MSDGLEPQPLVVIACSMPPSVNAIWRSRVGKGGKPSFYLDTAYREWRKAFDAAVMATRPRPRLAGPFLASITLDETHRRGDVDNRAKAVLDGLQRCGVIENDSLATKVIIKWGVAPEGCLVCLYPDHSIRRPQVAA